MGGGEGELNQARALMVSILAPWIYSWARGWLGHSTWANSALCLVHGAREVCSCPVLFLLKVFIFLLFSQDLFLLLYVYFFPLSSHLQSTRVEFDLPEYSVRRRYQDFDWLRNKLEESQPTHLIPVGSKSLRLASPAWSSHRTLWPICHGCALPFILYQIHPPSVQRVLGDISHLLSFRFAMLISWVR